MRNAAAYLSFHCGCPIVETPAEARFAFAGDIAELPPLASFALGTDEYPDRSTTLALEVGGLAEGSGVQLTGPGIRDAVRLGVAALPHRFWTERALLGELFPRGVDVLFVSGNRFAALPRTTRVSF
jgi:alpha-D-ribose 1-methylphosphonate 5-triphosphate synthase subunit PhnH